ncbi:MAG: arylsulfatase A-like enzyme [Rhodothermales bacterium]|jgi:arylsulfatase A-like enzyme
MLTRLILILLASASFAERPNVLFIAVDDMKDWTGYQGGYEGKVMTPNIDRLTARGRPFLNAHCPAPKCGPSRASIMHGQRPSTLGIYGNGQWVRPNYPDLVSIPAHFKANGYTTVGAGKIHHHTTGFNPPDQWHDYQEIEWEDPWDRPVRANYSLCARHPATQGPSL